MPRSRREGSPGLASHTTAVPFLAGASRQQSKYTLLLSLSENKKALRSAGGQPASSQSTTPWAGLGFRAQRTPRGLSWEVPPSVLKAAPPAAPGDPSMPQGREEAVQKAEWEKQGSQALPGSPAGGRPRTSWTHFSATLFGFLRLPDFRTQQETLKLVNDWFPFVETHEDEGNMKLQVVTQKQTLVDKDVTRHHTHANRYAFGFPWVQT